MSNTIASPVQSTPSFELATDVPSDASAANPAAESSPGNAAPSTSQDLPDRPAGEALGELASLLLPDLAALLRINPLLSNPLLDFALIGFSNPSVELIPGYAPSFAAANTPAPNRGITEAQYASVAKTLGVDVAAIKAVAQVESAGSGFLPSGKPKILFEAHVFHEKTNGKYAKEHPNLSSKKWNTALYGAAGEHQWKRFEAASKLDATAAMKSASWGRFQIMGFNFKEAGFPDLASFVKAMKTDEGAQLTAFSNLLQKRPGVLKALRAHDWVGVASGYNGDGYKKNDYDTKMAAAYASFSK